MGQTARKKPVVEAREKPVRVLGRGLRAARGVRLSLRALREATGKTQSEVAMAAQMDQGDVSRLERRRDFDDAQVSTLRRYAAALGGQIELVMTFGNRRIIVSAAHAPATNLTPANKPLRKTGRKTARS